MSWRCVDPRLCQDTVTVYHREGLTRQVLEGVHWETTFGADTDSGFESLENTCLLVVPYPAQIAPGDKVVAGQGAPITAWGDINAAAGAFTVRTVKYRSLMGRLSHLEARGLM
jgi:hypothetical protein